MNRIVDYAEHLYGQGRAERTIAEYIKWVRRLHRWAAERGYDLDELDAAQVRTWADTTVPMTWASRKQASVAVRTYYRTVGGRAEDVAAGVRVPRKPSAKPKPLRAEDATRLRDAAVMVGGRRGVATVVGMYGAGRASEIAAVRWDGVDPRPSEGAPHGVLRWWRTKTSDWHQVPMHPVLAGTLRQWRPMDAEGFLFAGNNGRPHVQPSTVWAWVRQVGEVAGVEVTPQQLRATAGKAVLEATGDIDAAAALLGHRDLNVTREFYTGVTSPERMARAVGSLNW